MIDKMKKIRYNDYTAFTQLTENADYRRGV